MTEHTNYINPWIQRQQNKVETIAALPEVVDLKVLTPKAGELGSDRRVGNTVRKGQLEASVPGVRMTHYIHDADRKAIAGTVMEYDLTLNEDTDRGNDPRLRNGEPTISNDGTVLKYEFDEASPAQVTVVYRNVNAPVNRVRATLPK